MSSSIPKPRTASSMSTHSPTTINIPLDSRVVLSKRRSGWVRYIGKIKNEAGEWYGIALDEGKGENDGSYEKERYFDCPNNHGVFVRRKEIFCVKEHPLSRTKSPPSPVMPDNSDAGSSTGSSVDSQDTPSPPPGTALTASSPSRSAPPVAPTTSLMARQATSVITPLIRTFKTFRKELGLQISPNKTASNNNSANSVNASFTSSPKSSTANTRSSGLKSPSNSRFGSFTTATSSPSSTSARTASIVSQMVVIPVEKPSDEAEVEKSAPPKSSSQVESFDHHQSDEQPQKQQQKRLSEPSFADLMGDSDGISSLSDLYRSSSHDKELSSNSRTDTLDLPVAPMPSPSPAQAATTTSTTTTKTASSSSTSRPQLTRVTSFSTAVESMKPAQNAEPAPAPLFFRRANIGSPTIGRRASFSPTNGSGTGASNDNGTSSPTLGSGKTSPTLVAAANARMVELEKEINVMKTNHENIVAVLRATNKQHAANVLELRAQVAALTEGNHWLEKQLASKNALVAELQQMIEASDDDHVPRAEVEKIIAIKDSQIHTLEKEIAKLKQHMLRIETEKDSILCQQVKHFRLRQESDEARINKLREDVLAMCNERTSLQSELQDLKGMTFLF